MSTVPNMPPSSYAKYRSPLLPGYTYHIYNRGNNREILFLSYRNYRYFLRLYKKYISPTGTTIAYCLLPNHFHFLIKFHAENTSPQSISKSFASFFGTYTKAINKSYGRTGKLFEGRFRRKFVVDQEYLRNIIAYIHRNPQSHGLVADFENWPHSSFAEILSGKEQVASWKHSLKAFQNDSNFWQAHASPPPEPLAE